MTIHLLRFHIQQGFKCGALGGCGGDWEDNPLFRDIKCMLDSLAYFEVEHIFGQSKANPHTDRNKVGC